MKHSSVRSGAVTAWLAVAAGLCLIAPSAAFAYVGPSAGITMIGIVVVIFGAIGAILYWPIRAMLRKKRAAAKDGNAGSDNGTAS
jgi:protein-S-isoprenylcysteine O-methyltransferase Ste14